MSGRDERGDRKNNDSDVESLEQLMAETDPAQAMELLQMMAQATSVPGVVDAIGDIPAIADAVDSADGSAAVTSDDDPSDDQDGMRLRRVEARYRALVEQIPAITFMAALDDTGSELYVSPHIETMLGFTQEEWLGDPFLWYRQLHPDDRQRWQSEFAKTCVTGKGFKSEYRFISRDNREVWVHGEATIVHDDRGLPAFLHGIAFDITESKRAEQVLQNARQELEREVQQRTAQLRISQEELLETHQRISAVLESAVDAIITIDSRGVIESANQATEQLFGYAIDEIIGQNVKVLMPEPYKSEHDGYLRRYNKTGEKHIIGIGREVTGRRKDGSVFPMHLAVSEVELGDKRLFTGIVRDITQQKAAQAQLADQAAALEAKNLELLGLKEDAEKANVAKSQFLANMSHELRTPMNAIIGYSELLMEELEDVDQTEFVPDLQKIRGAGKHLLSLINDILDLSKIEAGKMEVFAEDFVLAKFLEEVVATAKPLMDSKNNQLVIESDEDLGQMQSDRTKIRQVLFNLLSNAAKFTENGQITLKTRRFENAGSDWIELAVTDSGIGMTADQLTKIFDAFSQAEASTTRKFGGTGLGLTITKTFCEMLGGELNVDSELDVGSSFIVRLPARYDAESESTTDTENSQTTQSAVSIQRRNREVLIVDDDPTARDLMQRFLSKEGYATITASSGAEALQLAKKRKPLAITLDVMMPGMDGWDVLKELKADETTSDIPVVMISMVDGADIAHPLGVMDYLTKPPDRKRLGDILGQIRTDQSPGQVLIVDDDPNNRQMLARLVEKIDCEVIEASNGREALERIAKRKPDLILLDLMMPVMDGFQVVDELRKQGLAGEIPIVVLTAKDLTREDRANLQGQVQLIRNKVGISRNELLHEITAYLSHHCPDAKESES
ncbi:MAG: PAS domain S-box protein [Pirellulaceae bacterium]|nr:PAS domain S-box protein [Pirellulaceae bacterium]